MIEREKREIEREKRVRKKIEKKREKQAKNLKLDRKTHFSSARNSSPTALASAISASVDCSG